MSLSNDVPPMIELRHGAYICVGEPRDRRALVNAPVELLGRRFGFHNEFEARDGHPTEAVAFLRRVDTIQRQIDDDRLFHASAIVHVASPTATRVEQFCTEMSQMMATTPIAVSGTSPPWRGPP